jgi:hypothetical protein
MKIKKEVAIGIAIGAIAAACSIVSTIIAVNNRPQEGVSGSDDSSVAKPDDVSCTEGTYKSCGVTAEGKEVCSCIEDPSKKSE